MTAVAQQSIEDDPETVVRRLLLLIETVYQRTGTVEQCMGLHNCCQAHWRELRSSRQVMGAVLTQYLPWYSEPQAETNCTEVRS